MSDEIINSRHGEINAFIDLEDSKAATGILMRPWRPHRYEGPQHSAGNSTSTMFDTSHVTVPVQCFQVPQSGILLI